MTPEQYAIAESIGLNLFFRNICVYWVGDSGRIEKGDVPKFGRVFVWLVLFLGCAGFVAKAVIQFMWENNGIS